MFGTVVLRRAATLAPSPLKQQKLGLAELRAQVFQTQFNPTGERCGSKYLRQPPIGAAVLPYYDVHQQPRKIWTTFTNYLKTNRDLPFYPDNDDDRSPAEIRADMEESWRRRRMAKFGGLGLKPNEPYQDNTGVWRVEQKYIDEQEETRFVVLDRKRRLGKGHPKKGQNDKKKGRR